MIVEATLRSLMALQKLVMTVSEVREVQGSGERIIEVARIIFQAIGH